jgi:hypothetical protein
MIRYLAGAGAQIGLMNKREEHSLVLAVQRIRKGIDLCTVEKIKAIAFKEDDLAFFGFVSLLVPGAGELVWRRRFLAGPKKG